MTAFSHADAPRKEGGWAIEIRSLNHRNFDFSLKTPQILNSLEAEIRELVQARMRRGKVTVSISQDVDSQRLEHLSINEAVVEFYLSKISKLKKRFKLQGELTTSDILRLPGIFETPETTIEPEKVWPSLKKVLGKALEGAVKAKKIEGAKLAGDIESRLNAITKTLERVEVQTEGRKARIFKKLSERVAELIDGKSMDSERLEREVAFLAERSDITEEIVRMKSHLDLFAKKLKQDEEVGRELDFLCQEMNREVNTMASKSQSFEISTDVVFVKGELEKIREQIQNIE